MQVWAWSESYATQYRNTPNGGEAVQQAWSFGGNKTPLGAMPVGGSATYNGRFVATAKTANYLKPSGALVDPNALWRVQGASQLTANFGPSGTVAGTLTPETWTSYQAGLSGATYTKTVGVTPTPPYSAIETPNYSFYNTTVALNGTITGNTYAGTTAGSATLSGAFISGDETMYGGFFGAAGAETTGVFHVTGMDPDPIGGSAGINDDRRGYLTIQGAFHGYESLNDMQILGETSIKASMRTVFCALSCLMLVSTAVLGKASVTPSPQQISEYEASTESTRVKLLINLAKSGQHDLAETLLKRYPLTGPFGKNRQLFIKGLILKARGNLTGAAKNYRAALADDPSLTLVRAELAQTLFQLEEDDSAKHHLNLLMAEAPNDYEAQGIRSFIDTIDARRPFTFNAYVSVAPSTNVNNGSSNDTIYSPLWGVDMNIDDRISRAKRGRIFHRL